MHNYSTRLLGHGLSVRIVASVVVCSIPLSQVGCARRSAATPEAPYPVVPTPPATATSSRYPTVGPTLTRPPKPSPTSTAVPTPSATPTALATRQSAYEALWIENSPAAAVKKAATLWRANPQDVGGRQRILTFDGVDVMAAALAPDGRQVAVVTASWGTTVHPLWVANTDGSGLRQVAPSAGQPVWGADGSSIAYVFGMDDRVGLSTLTLPNGPASVVLPLDALSGLSLLGSSSDGSMIYFVSQTAKGGREFRAVDKSGRAAATSYRVDEDGDAPMLSPDRSQLMTVVRTVDAPKAYWTSVDDATRHYFAVPAWGQWCGISWSAKANEVLICKVDEKAPLQTIAIVNLKDTRTTEYGPFPIRPERGAFGPLSTSPGGDWVAASAGGKLQAAHLASGTVVELAVDAGRSLFVGWLPVANLAQ